MDNEPKEIKYPGHRLSDTTRGFEKSWYESDSPKEASRKGNGPRPFMGHSGPAAADSGIDRGQFSSRRVKQGPV